MCAHLHDACEVRGVKHEIVKTANCATIPDQYRVIFIDKSSQVKAAS